jgi:hypothetical protein
VLGRPLLAAATFKVGSRQVPAYGTERAEGRQSGEPPGEIRPVLGAGVKPVVERLSQLTGLLLLVGIERTVVAIEEVAVFL